MATPNFGLKTPLRRKNSEKKDPLKLDMVDSGGGHPRLESMIGGYTVEVIAGVVHRIPLESKTPGAKRKQSGKDNKPSATQAQPFNFSPENDRPKLITRSTSDNDLYSASGGHSRMSSITSPISNGTTKDDFIKSNQTLIPHFSPNPNGSIDKVTMRQKVVRSNSDGSRFTRTQAGVKIIRSGYCVKQSRSLTKAWKRFFMEFDPTEICFYNNDYKKKLIKKIKCNDEITDVKKSDSSKIKDRDNLMEIVMKSKKIFIQFDTPDDLAGWIEALRTHLGFSCRTYL